MTTIYRYAEGRTYELTNDGLSPHVHTWSEVDRDDNGDRIRTCDECPCGAVRYGCLAKRLDDEGRAAWGVPGDWSYSVREAGS